MNAALRDVQQHDRTSKLLNRDAWRALPMNFIVRPTLDAPMLAFSERRQLTAIKLHELLVEEHRRYRKAFTPERRIAHGLRMRKIYLTCVSLAIGVKLPGHPHVVHEFVD